MCYLLKRFLKKSTRVTVCYMSLMGEGFFVAFVPYTLSLSVFFVTPLAIGLSNLFVFIYFYIYVHTTHVCIYTIALCTAALFTLLQRPNKVYE